MRKQIVLAFVCGMVIPVALMLLSSLNKTTAEQNSMEDLMGVPPSTETIPETTERPSAFDAVTSVTVQMGDGESKTMPLNEYLTGVVLSEMPADFEEEALKAQAVVARTYTCKRMKNGKHDSAAVCTDPGCCQGYRSAESYLQDGGTEAGVERAKQAVELTDARVLTYEGELIDATYFSCSGGSTEDAVAVWGQDVPYLQAVDSPGEENAPRYEEKVFFTADEFRERTGCSGEGELSGWFGDVSYTEGNGVDTVEICGETYTGVQLREDLGLRSTAFSISVEDDMIVIETRGFGHRVGMSQYGAEAMAIDGKAWDEILTHYYQGATIESMEQD